MNLIVRFQNFSSAILFCVFSFVHPLCVNAQDKSAIDTIANLLKTQNDHIRVCADLYKLGNYYWNIGKIDNAQLAVDKCKELAEEQNQPGWLLNLEIPCYLAVVTYA